MDDIRERAELGEAYIYLDYDPDVVQALRSLGYEIEYNFTGVTVIW